MIGDWVNGDTGRPSALRNPAIGESLTRIALSNAVDVKRAVDAASVDAKSRIINLEEGPIHAYGDLSGRR
jgi:acyl-CoA reductase-like NAD-dependent aldehyde dehydrogenase